MLSILIPTHNYDIQNLVKEIHKQATGCKITFEVLYLEDASDAKLIQQNLAVNTLLNVHQLVSEINLGSVKTRQLLSDNATYDWLLFLDADVLPKSPEFISRYLKIIASGHDIIYGGFAYKAEKPDSNYVLRWAYGRKNEEVSSTIRNEKPYKITISANFLVRKRIFNQINSDITDKGYGYDNYFASLLKSNNVNVWHIDNEVYHLRIEKSEAYLSKSEEAVKNLLSLHNRNKLLQNDNKLLTIFLLLKKYRLHYLFSRFFKLFYMRMKKNLTSSNPNILIFQAYKIFYMCHQDLN